MRLSLSRANEYEADRYGVLYAYRAGYDPYASVRFLEKLIVTRGDIAPGGRYPTHSERIEQIHEYLTSVNILTRIAISVISYLSEHANYADSYYNLALIHENLSNYFEAAEAWSEYLRLAPQTGWKKRAIYHLEELQAKVK